MYKFFVLFIALLLFTVSSSSQTATQPAKSSVVFSTKEELDSSMKTVPCKSEERLEGVKKLFLAAGASEEDITIEKLDKDKISNLVVKKKGETDETVVIGAHYDQLGGGCGATDNWSGLTIISHIYKTIKPLTTKKSYLFVAFDQEEQGLKGSSQMLKKMPKEDLEKFCSMVNFDSFGQAMPMALRNISSGKLIKLAEQLGKDNDFKFNVVEIPGASSDSASFLDKKIPAITLSGLGSDWTQILHTSNDKLDKVKIDSVYLGYRFGVQVLATIDNAGCRDFK